MIGPSLSYGWETTKQNWRFLVTLMLLYGVIYAIPAMLSGNSANEFVAMIATLVLWILELVMSMGLIAITLRIIDKKPVKYSDLFTTTEPLLQYLIVNILVALIVMAGLILLVVPGVYLAMRTSLASYYVIEKKMGAIESIKASFAATKGHSWDLFLLMLALVGINLLGALAFLLGLLLTIPVSMLAFAWVYRKLSGGHAPAVHAGHHVVAS